MKILAGILGGLLLALLARVLVFTLFSSAVGAENKELLVGFFFVLFLALGLVEALLASTVAKAWSRIFITSAILCFIAPITSVAGTLISTILEAGKLDELSGLTALAFFVGGGLLTVIIAFTGLFLGLTFLVLGLLIGRDKQIIYIEKQIK